MTTKKDILVHVDKRDNQIKIQTAVVQNGELVDYSIDNMNEQSLVGNIYKGSVTNIFPGTQSCFVNIGTEKNAILFAKDLISRSNTAEPRPIETLLRTGQKVIVQVLKDATGDKGSRVTTKITLPGKYLVLLPGVEQIAVSRKISAPEEQLRLKTFIKENAPEGFGLIARTESKSVAEYHLLNDLSMLKQQWNRLQKKESADQIPLCIHLEYDIYKKLLFKIMENNISRLIVDEKNPYKELLNRASSRFSDISYKIQLYSEPYHIFAFYGISGKIKNLSARKIWLNCGAYIVIDKTEAMTVIDVNSGKFTGQRSFDETVLKINTESVIESARQIRMRDIGGIIIIDIIRMSNSELYKPVLSALEEELKKDKQKTTVVGITRLGLLELTRKKTGIDLLEKNTHSLMDAEGK